MTPHNRIIRIGYSNHPPFSYKHPNQDCITGESFEIATHILKQLGFHTIQPKETDFWALIPQLKSGVFDMIASGLLITPSRLTEVAFTHPTYQDSDGIMIHHRNPHRIHQFDDVIHHPLIKVAAVFGSFAMETIRLVPPNRRVPCLDLATALDAIVSGQADCVIGSTLALRQAAILRPYPELRLRTYRDGFSVPSAIPVEFGGIAMRKRDTTLLAAFNQALTTFIGSPSHLKLVAPFGIGISELPALHPHFESVWHNTSTPPPLQNPSSPHHP